MGTHLGLCTWFPTRPIGCVAVSVSPGVAASNAGRYTTQMVLGYTLPFVPGFFKTPPGQYLPVDSTHFFARFLHFHYPWPDFRFTVEVHTSKMKSSQKWWQDGIESREEPRAPAPSEIRLKLLKRWSEMYLAPKPAFRRTEASQLSESKKSDGFIPNLV